jgi:hypothetical protein
MENQPPLKNIFFQSYIPLLFFHTIPWSRSPITRDSLLCFLGSVARRWSTITRGSLLCFLNPVSRSVNTISGSRSFLCYFLGTNCTLFTAASAASSYGGPGHAGRQTGNTEPSQHLFKILLVHAAPPLILS